MENKSIQESVKSLILRDKHYAEQMETIVEPYLDNLRQEVFLARKDSPEQKLYCAVYSTDTENILGVVVISHGFTENADKYKEVIYYFLKMGYHVYMADHCGHGRSYRLTDDLSLVHVDRYERYIEDLLLVAHEAKAAYPALNLYLYGHSMGGGIAAATVAAEPDLFTKVILTSPMIMPDTHGVPWRIAEFVSTMNCLLGKDNSYFAGSHPYEDNERFEDSASTSRARFDYQQIDRRTNPLFQTTAPSYQWTKNAARLYRFLIKKGWKKYHIPLLIFQSENDGFVSPKAQFDFARKIIHMKKSPTWLIKIPGSKHEIFNSTDKVLVKYWIKVFKFLSFMAS